MVKQSLAGSSCVLSHGSLSTAFFCSPGAGRHPLPGPSPSVCHESHLVRDDGSLMWTNCHYGGTWRLRDAALDTSRGESVGGNVCSEEAPRDIRGVILLSVRWGVSLGVILCGLMCSCLGGCA